MTNTEEYLALTQKILPISKWAKQSFQNPVEAAIKCMGKAESLAQISLVPIELTLNISL